ncbi:DUF6541 family protein [Thermocrispum agreste]|jgi:hypothetical protein|nr:DUF6541 family protein [Thermocrispum agreste]
MPDEPIWLSVAAVATYLAVLAVPGTAIGLVCRLRGWLLVALAPLLGYAVLGIAGPWLHLMGLPFTVLTAIGSAVVGVLLTAVVVYAIPASLPDPQATRRWSRRDNVAVACCVALAFVLSIVVVVLAARGELNAVLQRWDPVFHANGIRYIAETGDGGLYGVSSVNRYGPEGSQFYPNAYHLAGSLVYLITGGSVPLVMTAMIMPLGGIYALSMAALVRECGGRAAFAGATAVVSAVAASGVYESISNGLLPFALSIAMTPLGPLAVLRFVRRPGADTAVVLSLVCAGMLAVHSSALFAIVLLSLPLLLHRWWRHRDRVWRDVKRLLLVAAPTMALTAPHLLGALDQASGAYGYRPWASDQPIWGALFNLVAFQHARPEPQLALTALVVIGLIGYRRLGELRWIGGAAVLFGVLWLLVASFGGVDWVAAISRPWWNDRPRIIALAVLPLCIIAGHGLALVYDRVRRRLRPRPAPMAAAAVAVLFGAGTLAFGVPGNVDTTARLYHNGPDDTRETLPVSEGEIKAMRVLAALAEPDERVMNDRNDGSVWMYALTGVKTVAAHYDENVPPKDAAYLEQHFREYRTDPEVRAAVRRLNIKHVFVGDGSRFPRVLPDPGVQGLENADFVRLIYRNEDARVYELVP